MHLELLALAELELFLLLERDELCVLLPPRAVRVDVLLLLAGFGPALLPPLLAHLPRAVLRVLLRLARRGRLGPRFVLRLGGRVAALVVVVDLGLLLERRRRLRPVLRGLEASRRSRLAHAFRRVVRALHLGLGHERHHLVVLRFPLELREKLLVRSRRAARAHHVHGADLDRVRLGLPVRLRPLVLLVPRALLQLLPHLLLELPLLDELERPRLDLAQELLLGDVGRQLDLAVVPHAPHDEHGRQDVARRARGHEVSEAARRRDLLHERQLRPEVADADQTGGHLEQPPHERARVVLAGREQRHDHEPLLVVTLPDLFVRLDAAVPVHALDDRHSLDALVLQAEFVLGRSFRGLHLFLVHRLPLHLSSQVLRVDDLADARAREAGTDAAGSLRR